MPPKPRKKWGVKLVQPDATIATYYTQVNAYRYVQSLAFHSRTEGPLVTAREVEIFIDEREGRGWELFERVNLADVAS